VRTLKKMEYFFCQKVGYWFRLTIWFDVLLRFWL
jgi:hypothetical protein